MNCELLKDQLFCGQGKAKEEYISLTEKNVFISRSKSGNIFILGDLANKKYSMAMSFFIPENMSLMTKHCSGKIKY
jgi:hypothetical protein